MIAIIYLCTKAWETLQGAECYVSGCYTLILSIRTRFNVLVWPYFIVWLAAQGVMVRMEPSCLGDARFKNPGDEFDNRWYEIPSVIPSSIAYLFLRQFHANSNDAKLGWWFESNHRPRPGDQTIVPDSGTKPSSQTLEPHNHPGCPNTTILWFSTIIQIKSYLLAPGSAFKVDAWRGPSRLHNHGARPSCASWVEEAASPWTNGWAPKEGPNAESVDLFQASCCKGHWGQLRMGTTVVWTSRNWSTFLIL